MKPFTDLVHDAMFPSTRIYRDAEGNYAGSSTDITPIILLIARCWGLAIFLFYILTPLLAPVYYGFAHWFCHKYDAYFMKEDPKGWPMDKARILKDFRNIFWGWIIFMGVGLATNFGANRTYDPYYTQPSVSSAQYVREHGK